MRPWRAAIPALAIACGALVFVAGGPATSPTTTTGEGVALAAGVEIEYRLAWSWAGARWLADEQTHVFTTDLGYTVGLVGGQVGSASLELVPCEPTRGLLAPRPAAAAHASLADDSRAWAPTLETLPAAQSSYFGAGVASGRRYCGLHYLIAPVPGDPSHASAAIRGWYRRPGGQTRVAFDVAVNVRGGALRDLGPIAVAGDRGATVVLRRHPARALDGAALAQLGERELAYAFLRGLGRTATVELAPR